MNILVLQTEHLRLLERAHAAVRRQHEHTNPLLSAHGVLGRAAGVATGGTQNIELFAAPRQLVLKQVAQQLHCHVFEGQGWAVGQSLKV